MTGDRFRLVTFVEGEEHVSGVVLGADEWQEILEVDAYTHELAGWVVTRGPERFVARRGGRYRVVEVRRYEALADAREGAGAF